MTSVFVDTSAIYALLVVNDARHDRATTGFQHLQQSNASLVSTSFVLLESAALLQSRTGMASVRRLDQALVPLLEVVWVDHALYARAMTALLAAGDRSISLVDWSSFELMRSRGMVKALAFDQHFVDQGFTLVA